jgi:hypothetical protein
MQYDRHISAWYEASLLDAYDAYCAEHDEWFGRGYHDAMQQVYAPPPRSQTNEHRGWYHDGIFTAYQDANSLPVDVEACNDTILF